MEVQASEVAAGVVANMAETVANSTQSAVEPVTPEVTTEIAKPDLPKDDKFSAKFAALSRKEKMIFEREKQLKEMEAKYKGYDSIDSSVKSDPLAFMQKYGITYNDLTRLVLNDNKPTPDMEVKSVKEEMANLRRELAQKEADAQKTQFESTIGAFKSEIKQFIDSAKDTYELLAMQDTPDEIVYNVISEHFNKTQKILTHKEAADHVEKYLEDEARKYLSVKKFQPKAPEAPATTSTQKSVSQTLTNTMDANAPTPSGDDLDPSDPYYIEKSRDRAARLLKFK
jgi:hypothetical protein